MMTTIVASVFLVAAFLGCEAIFPASNYGYGGCIPKECSQDWTFSYVSCGCVKDGDGAALTAKSIAKSRFPFGGGFFGRFPNILPIGGGGGGQVFVPIPGQPGTVVVPGAPAPGTVVLPGAPAPGTVVVPGAPAPGTIFLPGPPGSGPIIVPGPAPPRCARVQVCSAGQFFDENQCACVCIPQACLPNQRFNSQFCQCECAFQLQQCQPFEVFNPSTCQCEHQGCPNTCNRCENQNPNTCACQPIVNCPNGQMLNHDTCQCTCSIFTQCPNSFQRLNHNSCQCECALFTATIRQEIPGPTIPPSFEPGTPRSAPGTRRPGTSRTPGGRRRGKRAIIIDADDIEGPEMDSIALSRAKRRRTRTRPGTRSRPGTRTLRPGTPNFVPGSQGPPTIITTTQTVSSCPAGTVQNDFSCTCN